MTPRHPLDRNPQRAVSRRNSQSVESAPKHGRPEHPLLTLQSQVGNATIARMLAQRAAEEEEVQAKHDPALAQRQDEEDDVQLQRDPALAQRDDEEDIQMQRDSALAQRQPQEEDDMVQAKHDVALAQREPEVGAEGGPISDALANRIQSKRGGGTALDEDTRGDMERAFGTSFADVRIHTDGEADALNRKLSAKAFTTGSDIFFQSGAYQPNSSDGRKLLSHELTHVVQQRSMSSSGPMRVSPAGDAQEQEADAVAAQVASATAQRETEE